MIHFLLQEDKLEKQTAVRVHQGVKVTYGADLTLKKLLKLVEADVAQ